MDLMSALQQAEKQIAEAAAELPQGAWPLLYSHAGAIDVESYNVEQPAQHYLVSICIRDNRHKFSFPLIVIPHIVAHVPWRKDILEERLGNYRPRFASSSILVKHAFLILVADLFIRPFDLPQGSVCIDPENSNLLLYDILIPDDFDMRSAQSFVQTYLYPPKATGSRTSRAEKLGLLYPACPITLFPSELECSHLLDHRVGRSLFQRINQGLHDEATRTGRYGDLLKPWEGLVWTGRDIDGQLNQVHLMLSLHNTRRDWAFLAVLEHAHDDDAFSNDMLHFVHIWAEPRPARKLPAYVFLHFGPEKGEVSPTPRFDLRPAFRALWLTERTLSGLSTVWFDPDQRDFMITVTDSQSQSWPPLTDWFPAHPAFPPPYAFNNTLAARIVGMFRSCVVDAFAARARRVPRACDELRARSTPVSGESDTNGESRKDTKPDGQPFPSRLDRPDGPLGILSLALLSLAAVYTMDDNSERL